MSKISIILPVYNVEKYLSYCLDSIINQTFNDFTCLCIDDSSSDKSFEILQEYANKDNRIMVSSQQNQGVYAIRNKLIQQADSEYITFIDSDDWVDINYLKKMYDTAISTNSDIVCCHHKLYFQEDNYYKITKNKDKIKKTLNNYIFIDNYIKKRKYIFKIANLHRTACMKLFKTEIIKNNNIYFYKHRTAEDYPFSVLTFLYAHKFIFIDDDLYFYRKQVVSVTKDEDMLRLDEIYNIIDLTKELYDRHFKSVDMMKYVIDAFLYRIGKVAKLSKDKRSILIPVIKEHLKYLIHITKNIYLVDKLKLKFTLYLFNKYEKNAFQILRVLKNVIVE